MDRNTEECSPPDDPCANFRDTLDESAHVLADHAAFDGGDHITVEDIERDAADRWCRDRIAEIDEADQPEETPGVTSLPSVPGSEARA